MCAFPIVQRFRNSVESWTNSTEFSLVRPRARRYALFSFACLTFLADRLGRGSSCEYLEGRAFFLGRRATNHTPPGARPPPDWFVFSTRLGGAIAARLTTSTTFPFCSTLYALTFYSVKMSMHHTRMKAGHNVMSIVLVKCTHKDFSMGIHH